MEDKQIEVTMDSTLPDWVTKGFFEECIRREEGNPNIVVTNLTVSPAVAPGNNYSSYIIRVGLNWKTNENDIELRSSKFIVKAELTEGPIKDMITELQINETLFYYKFIPAAKEFSDTDFAPTSFFTSRPKVIILEDLKEKGFVMADRTKQLDFNHCRLYMIAAAKFHAVSVPVFKRYPELLEPINRDMMFSNELQTQESFKQMIKGGMKKFIESMEKFDKFKKYTNTLKDLTPHLWDLLVDAHKPSEVINTIRQGDPWVTNMMFTYDKEGEVCDIKIIDFQGTSYGSPVADLMLFIWLSTTFEVKNNHLQELFRIYVENFNENLKRFNCTEKLTYDQLLTHVKKLSPDAIFYSVCFFPGMVHPEPMDLNSVFSDNSGDAIDKFYAKYYTDDYQQNMMPKLLKSLEDNGVFAYLENNKN